QQQDHCTASNHDHQDLQCGDPVRSVKERAAQHLLQCLGVDQNSRYGLAQRSGTQVAETCRGGADQHDVSSDPICEVGCASKHLKGRHQQGVVRLAIVQPKLTGSSGGDVECPHPHAVHATAVVGM